MEKVEYYLVLRGGEDENKIVESEVHHNTSGGKMKFVRFFISLSTRHIALFVNVYFPTKNGHYV